MKNIIIFLFCLVSGISLGNIAGTSMSMVFAIDLPTGPYIGAVVGGVLGLLLSPLFILRGFRGNIFEVLVLCFSLAFPVALISGFTRRPWLSIGFTLVTIFSIYFVALKKTDNVENISLKKHLFVIPIVIIILTSIAAYFSEDKMLPDDVPRLIELMGDNDLKIHTAAARKLMKHGKEPFLEALQHKNPNIRAVAAHYLGLIHDPFVQDALVESSHDSDPYVRMWSAFSLGEIGDEKAMPALTALLNDREKVVRVKTEEAINRLQGRLKR